MTFFIQLNKKVTKYLEPFWLVIWGYGHAMIAAFVGVILASVKNNFVKVSKLKI